MGSMDFSGSWSLTESDGIEEFLMDMGLGKHETAQRWPNSPPLASCLPDC